MNPKLSIKYLQSIQDLLKNPTTNSVAEVMQFMHEHIPGYDWSGVYIMNATSQTLHLGPFAGAPTDHLIIPFSQGICGQVAVSGNTYLADDVGAEGNYIACSTTTKSEIVVPVYLNGVLIAQIDIDSHVLANFNEIDEAFLTQVAEWIAPLLGDAYSELNPTS